MKKLLVIICCIVVLIAAPLIWWDQGSRNFYCFSDGRCFTIWKRVGGKCYFIPHKYYNVIAPTDDYILTANWASIGVVNDKKRLDKIIVEGDSSCRLIQKKPGVVVFYNDERGNKEFDSLYTHLKDNHKVYNSDIEFYTIDILEMYVCSNVKNQTSIAGSSSFGVWSIIVFFVYIILLLALIVVTTFRLMDELRKKRSTPIP